MPCEASPTAKPRAAKSLMRSAFISGVTMTAPRMPVVMTSTAVSAGTPPRFSDTAMAMPAVTDFGAIETSTWRGAPKAAAIATADTQATIAPEIRAAAIGSRLAMTKARWRTNGTAMATVAGPSRKCTNCAPSKYF